MIQIDQDLWADLVRYHVMDLRDPDVDARIRARQRYLDMVGVPEDYRRAPDNTTNNT